MLMGAGALYTVMVVVQSAPQTLVGPSTLDLLVRDAHLPVVHPLTRAAARALAACPN